MWTNLYGYNVLVSIHYTYIFVLYTYSIDSIDSIDSCVYTLMF